MLIAGPERRLGCSPLRGILYNAGRTAARFTGDHGGLQHVGRRHPFGLLAAATVAAERPDPIHANVERQMA